MSLVTHFRDDSGTRHTRLLRRYDPEEWELAENERRWLRSVAGDSNGPVPVGMNGHFEAVGLEILSRSFPLYLPAAPHLFLRDACSFMSWAIAWASKDVRGLISQTQPHLNGQSYVEFSDWLGDRSREELVRVLQYKWELPSNLKEGKC